MTWFPNLEELKITVCPKLSSLLFIPWPSATRYVTFAEDDSSIVRLSFKGYSSNRYKMKIKGRMYLIVHFGRCWTFIICQS